jgi:group I intron endonuclease
MTKIAGVYKITSPSGRIYIGQSYNIEARFSLYRRLKGKGQRLLYNSLVKYSPDKHIFEIIHQLPNDVTQAVLDTYEILYINLYRECGLALMNLKDGGSKGKHSNETRAIISQRIKGRSLSESHRNKISDNFKGEKHPFYGKKANQSHCKNISNALKGKAKSDNHKHSLSRALKGKYLGVKKPEGHGAKVSKALKGRTFTKEHLEKIGKASIGRNAKPLLQLNLDGMLVKEWPSVVIAATELQIQSSNIINCMRGRQKTYKGFTWRYK